MRNALAQREEERSRFVGTFERFGSKRAFKGPDLQTILLKDIRDAMTGKAVCDHLWFNLTRGFAAPALKPGEYVAFDARVKAYEKGYEGRRWDVFKPIEVDYKLSHPTRIEKWEDLRFPEFVSIDMHRLEDRTSVVALAQRFQEAKIFEWETVPKPARLAFMKSKILSDYCVPLHWRVCTVRDRGETCQLSGRESSGIFLGLSDEEWKRISFPVYVNWEVWSVASAPVLVNLYMQMHGGSATRVRRVRDAQLKGTRHA